MPQRPRSHELEDESRRHFQMALPSRWVFRPADPDYGIDGQVELFGTDREATGLVLLVQLKATDNPKLEEALAIPFRRDTFRYYRRLDLPVMLVLFHAPTRSLFWAWLHAFDPEYKSRGKETYTLRLSAEAAWNSQTPVRIQEDLHTFRRLKSPQAALPIEFRLMVQEPTLHSTPAVLVESAILDAARAHAASISLLRGDREGAHPKILVRTDRTEVTLAGLKSLTLHTDKGYPREFATTKFPHDVLTAVGAVLAVAGHSNIAAEIGAKHLHESSLLHTPEVVFTILGALSRAGRITDALQLANRLVESTDQAFLLQFITLPILVNSPSLSASEVENWRHLMRSIIERAERARDKAAAATAHYNLGNHLRAQGYPHRRAAFKQYRLAAKLDENYRRRDYFWKELAGILFALDRFEPSARAYQKAIDLGTAGESVALLADALMFAGKYRQAPEIFTRYCAREKNVDSEWRLKSLALERMIEFLGVGEQRRQIHLANNLADVGKEPDSEKASLSSRKALTADALCALAWFNLAVSSHRLRGTSDAFLGFTLAALIGRVDTEAWANSLLVAFETRELEALCYIAQTAYSINGTAFLQALHTLLQSQDKRFPVDEFLEAIRKVISVQEVRDRSLEIRFLGEDAAYRSIQLGREDLAQAGLQHDQKGP